MQKMPKTTFVDLSHLPSISVIAKMYFVTLTYFLKVIYLKRYISETIRVSAKMHGTTFLDFDYLSLKDNFLYSMTVTYFLNFKYCKH